MNRRAPVALTLLFSACAPAPIEWGATGPLPGAHDESVRLEMRAGSGPSVVTASFPPTVPAPAGCAASLRRVLAREGGPAYAAWWRARPDSSAELLVARSDDGGATWSAATVAESRDRSTLGCARPEPGVAADPLTGTVHVAYWATLPDGPGIFFSHATNASGVGAPTLAPEHLAHAQPVAGDGGAMAAPSVLWHAPVAVVHGERPSRAAVTVRGDTVAVAFEDPNSGPRPRIALAWSRQTGHLFDLRDHAVSTADVAASRPMAALRGDSVAVAWREESGWRVRVGRVRAVGGAG